jgi:O-antigen ligase
VAADTEKTPAACYDPVMNIAPHRAAGNVRRSPGQLTSRVRDKVLSPVLGVLIWLLVLYWAVPGDIFTPSNDVYDEMMSAPNLTARTIKIIILVTGLIIMLQRSGQARLLLKNTNPYFLIFLVLAPLSVVWSISPGDTLARCVSVFAIVSISAAFCMAGWHQQRLQNVLRPVLSVLLLGSIALYFYNPDLALEHGEGTLHNSWHGLTAQKNTFGDLSSYGVVLWLHAVLSKQVPRIRALAGFALSFSCVFLSRSSTSLLASVFACGFMLLLLWSPKYLRRYMPYIVATFALLVLSYALAVLNLVPGLHVLLKPVMYLTGKDMTFSNRTEVWRIVRDHIQLSPLKGSGYGAYWIGGLPTSPSYRMVQELYFYPAEAHNGYLEITNDLGFIGLTVLIGYLLTYVRHALKVLRTDRAQGALFLGLFFQQAIINLSESTWLAINAGAIFAIMTLATMALARSMLDHRTAARAVPGPLRPPLRLTSSSEP